MNKNVIEINLLEEQRVFASDTARRTLGVALDRALNEIASAERALAELVGRLYDVEYAEGSTGTDMAAFLGDAARLLRAAEVTHQVVPGVMEGQGLIEAAGSEARCRECGCTDADCSDCTEATGVPCYWVAPPTWTRRRPRSPNTSRTGTATTPDTTWC
jgi:hypothetical protein